MKFIYGLLLIGWLAADQVLKLNMDILSIASLLGVLCLFIIKERFFNKNYASAIFLALILLLSQYNSQFILLSGISILDFVYSRRYPLGAIVFIISSVLSIQSGNYSYEFHLISAALIGYILGEKDNNEKNYTLVLDKERRLRYRLEKTQNELIHSRKEIEQLTEIRERNRIAHEIHDNIGHSIAGVIFQVEAARRIMNKDKNKLEDILKLCSLKLSEALELTRNTVYNIKVDKKAGIEMLEKVINDFKFCSITFNHTGDFKRVSMSNLKILEANLMECLTNASKYSQAKNINIKIDIGKKNIRFYYKDDGVGCEDIRENLGISGMSERIKNVGGTIAIDGNNGFLIVCNLPVKTEADEGDEGFENFNR